MYWNGNGVLKVKGKLFEKGEEIPDKYLDEITAEAALDGLTESKATKIVIKKEKKKGKVSK